MREKIRINDLSILFICPSDKWGVLERRVINDCHYLRDLGGNPVLYCLKGSALDKEAQNYSLPRLFYKGKKVNKLFDLTYFLDIKNVLKEGEFDIVHCFNLDYVWTLCWLLMTKPNIPLFLTFNRFIKKIHDGLIETWLFKRIDLLMTFSETTRSIAINYLPVIARKVHVVGTGVEILKQNERDINNKKIVGCFVTDESEIENIRTFLYAVNPIIDSLKDKNKGSQIRFFIYSNRPISEILDKKILDEKIDSLGISSYVDYVETENITDAIRKTNVFVSCSFSEPFSDIEIMASLLLIPVVIPRTAARQNFVNKFPDIGSTYYFQDSRELRENILEILHNESEFINSLENHHEKLLLIHGIDSYVEKVHGQYIRLYAQRVRLASAIEKN